MSKQYRPQPSVLPGDILSLEGNQLPIHSQVPKGTQLYPTSRAKHVIIDGKDYTHCPFENQFVPGKPRVENPSDAPKVTNKDGPEICYCPSCGKVLSQTGTPMYNTGLGGSVTPSSNKGRVAPRG